MTKIKYGSEPVSIILSITAFAGAVYLIVFMQCPTLASKITLLILMWLSVMLYGFSIAYGTKIKNEERLNKMKVEKQ